jgi:hypothetical protein
LQHLVREHKKTEPKVKSRGSGSSKVKPSPNTSWQQAQDDEVWRLVESCKHETSSKPRDEPCKFCGNVCNSWKKLSVHMGKHMEQIAMPILELVNMKEVAPDTVISPIEQNYGQHSATTAGNMLSTTDQNALSPYAMSAQSTYQSSSAGHSPATRQAHPQMNHFGLDQGYYSHGMNTPVQGLAVPNEAFGNGTAYTASTSYAITGMPGNNQFAPINTQLGSYPGAMQTPVAAHSIQAVTPRSQPPGSTCDSNQISYGGTADMPSYAQYNPAPAPGQFSSEAVQHLDHNQHYNMGTHSRPDGYPHDMPPMRAGNLQYHRYS